MRVELVEGTHGPRAVAPLEAMSVGAGAVFADKTRTITLGDCFKRGDRGSQDANVRFNDRPIHGGADRPCRVGVDKHFRDEGYAHNRRDTGTVNQGRSALRSGSSIRKRRREMRRTRDRGRT